MNCPDHSSPMVMHDSEVAGMVQPRASHGMRVIDVEAG